MYGPNSHQVCFKALDVIGKTAFGYDFNSLENPDDHVNVAFQGLLDGSDVP